MKDIDSGLLYSGEEIIGMICFSGILTFLIFYFM